MRGVGALLAPRGALLLVVAELALVRGQLLVVLVARVAARAAAVPVGVGGG